MRSGHSNTWNLLAENPVLAKEWHPIRNGSLIPKNIAPNSHSKVWWICRNGHEWQAVLSSRNRGNGCPYCAGQAVCWDNCLQNKKPELARDWHPKKNGELIPKDVTSGSNKRVWWKCLKGHEWQAVISSRNAGTGCPYCSNQKACNDNCLQTIYPELAREWHPIKNGRLTPKDVTPGSRRIIWWICNKGHEWQELIKHRSRGCGCPYCSGHRANEDNCLQTINFKLAKEWHPNKNGGLTPINVTPNSNKIVWWICKRGHEWKASINSRNRGNSCPYCHSQTSRLELRLYSELRYFFKSIEHRKKIFNLECDLFVPGINIAFEIDGLYWHRNRYKEDKKKMVLLGHNNVLLLRIREKGLKRISANDIFVDKNGNDFNIVCLILKRLMGVVKLKDKIRNKIEKYMNTGKFVNDEEYLKLLYTLPSPFPSLSLFEKNPELAKQWHPTRNIGLNANDVYPGSHRKAWWICNKGHEWEATIKNRHFGYGCPFCSGQAACEDNCLQNKYPELSKEWHHKKNGEITPRDVTPGSNKKMWWICKKKHEWTDTISHRVIGRKCPYCSNKRASEDNCLQNKNPLLAKEWHPTRNGSLSPSKVTPGSDKTVWWICRRKHEWRAKVYNRNNGSGCPYCAGKKVCDENSLQMQHPVLAKEWYFKKNGKLTPSDVTLHTNRKVWWKCIRNHVWQETVNGRSRGLGCPYCSGRRACIDNCLQTINPDLTKEWHPIKNENLTPQNVTPHYSKKVWWFCKNKHEWQATVDNRSNGRGCPYCAGRNKVRPAE